MWEYLQWILLWESGPVNLYNSLRDGDFFYPKIQIVHVGKTFQIVTSSCSATFIVILQLGWWVYCNGRVLPLEEGTLQFSFLNDFISLFFKENGHYVFFCEKHFWQSAETVGNTFAAGQKCCLKDVWGLVERNRVWYLALWCQPRMEILEEARTTFKIREKMTCWKFESLVVWSGDQIGPEASMSDLAWDVKLHIFQACGSKTSLWFFNFGVV